MRFDLAPLATRDALALARTFLTANPDVALRCVERAQGNPLFLTQLLRSGADGATIPGTIQSVVLARLDRLPPRGQGGAAGGRGRRPALRARRCCGICCGDPAYDAATLRRRATSSARDGDDGGRLMFVHALIRDGAYASLLHSARRALHLRAAEWYAGRDATLHAEHLDRADDPRAAAAYLAAARGEAAALRIDAALRLAAPRRRTRRAGRRSGMRSPRSKASSAATPATRRARSPRSSARCRSRPTMRKRCAAWIGIAAGHRVTSTVPPAFAALDRAQALAERSGLDRELSRIHYLRGNLHFALGDGPACRTEHERALELAQRAGDAECEAQALSGLGDAHYADGRDALRARRLLALRRDLRASTA